MITHREKLLLELIDAIQEGKRPSGNFDNLYVHFFTKGGDLITDDPGIVQALDYLANDIWHFEDFDLTDAVRLEIHTH